MMFEELICDLANVPSTIQKADMLANALWSNGKENAVMVDMFYMALNPHILYYRAPAAIPWELAGSKSEDGLSKHWSKISIILRVVAQRQLSRDYDIKNTFTPIIEQLSPKAADALRKIINKDLRCNVAAKTINKAIKRELIPEDAVQLANKCDEKTIATDEMWYASPKLDGIRAYYDNGAKGLRSRQGKSFYGLDKIEEYCAAIAEEFMLTFLDGELLVADAPDFSTTESIVSLTAKNKKYTAEAIAKMKDKVLFCIFACGRDEYQFEDTGTMVKTLQDIEEELSKDWILGIKDRILVLPQQYMASPTMDDVFRVTKEYVDEGFEGSMWRSHATPYNYKRSNALLKYKFMGEALLTITGIFPGKGKYEGMAGGIVCEGIVNKIVSHVFADPVPVKVEVGSGFDDITRKEINKSWIGKTVCIFYQDITQSKEEKAKGKDGVYSLRFPVFHGFDGKDREM